MFTRVVEVNSKSGKARELRPCRSRGGARPVVRPGAQIANADFFLPVPQIGDETAVDAHMLGHVDLCPPPLLAEFTQPTTKPDADITGHAPNNGCRLSPINRL